MTPKEVTAAKERIEKYEQLQRVHLVRYSALEKITRANADAPNGVGPFTGSMRESRTVESITIKFSPTRGGGPGVVMDISGLNIEGEEFGMWLADILRAELKRIDEEIKNL